VTAPWLAEDWWKSREGLSITGVVATATEENHESMYGHVDAKVDKRMPCSRAEGSVPATRIASAMLPV
jgi:hypothetical protein